MQTIIDDLVVAGCVVTDKSTYSYSMEADHSHSRLDSVFKKHGWRKAHDDGSALRPVAYKLDHFAGGNAVLHFKDGTVHYLTFSFHRNFLD
ncbi:MULTISPECIES: hypothetical protein [Vibrio harveyi group]|uniref:hypothetical protein n=1 Tax=Vibrio harveyi group TaxID=717610 RepID=UPI0015F452B2|nr:hypothetical protein [Vibrio alginolyticus]EJE4208672.1 hypothetical protein [Vibrio parahaemolyticus]HDM8060780.1 hypothetical protein [Vibrio harveyi]